MLKIDFARIAIIYKYGGYYSGFLGGIERDNAKICGFSNGKGDGFDTFCIVASDNKIYQFEVIKS
jgi:mannosyltransferase OCH1-like enzyme